MIMNKEIDQSHSISAKIDFNKTVGEVSVSSSKNAHFCKFCRIDLKNRQAFLDHFEKVHPAITDQGDMFKDPWPCMFCEQVFASANRLSLHNKSSHQNKLSLKDQLLNDGKSTQLHECKICGAMSKTAQYLVKHTLKMHGNELTKNGNVAVKDPRTCGVCGQLCSGEHGLRCHLYWTHGKEFGKVDQAFKTFVDMELKASAEKTFTVPKKSKKMKTNEEKTQLQSPYGRKLKPRPKPVSSILSQTKNSENDSILHCLECRSTFENLDLIKRHRDLRHVNVQCPICSEWCKGRIGLESHDDQIHFGALKFQLTGH